MGDLKDARLIYLKGFLFLVAGIVAAGVLLFDSLSLRTAFLLLVAVWSWCRWYYFLFYVIEKYVDGDFKFAGFGSFLAYLAKAENLKTGKSVMLSAAKRLLSI